MTELKVFFCEVVMIPVVVPALSWNTLAGWDGKFLYHVYLYHARITRVNRNKNLHACKKYEQTNCKKLKCETPFHVCIIWFTFDLTTLTWKQRVQIEKLDVESWSVLARNARWKIERTKCVAENILLRNEYIPDLGK